MRTLRSILGRIGGEVVRLDPYWFRDDGPPARGDSVSYGRWRNVRDGDERLSDFLIPKYTGFSDYSGCDVERSNHRLFLEMLQGSDGTMFLETYGGHGTTDVLVRLDTTDDEVLDCLIALEDYPAIDDEDCSRVADELFQESWESWIADDFTREVEKAFRLEITDLSRADLSDVFFSVMGRANVYPEVETGGGVYVDLDRIVAAMTIQDLPEGSFKLDEGSETCIQYGATYHVDDDRTGCCSDECFDARILTGPPVLGGTVPVRADG